MTPKQSKPLPKRGAGKDVPPPKRRRALARLEIPEGLQPRKSRQPRKCYVTFYPEAKFWNKQEFGSVWSCLDMAQIAVGSDGLVLEATLRRIKTSASESAKRPARSRPKSRTKKVTPERTER